MGRTDSGYHYLFDIRKLEPVRIGEFAEGSVY